jgi:hypothetical protein
MMFLNIENIEIPLFRVRQDAEIWINKHCGIRLWHATRVLDIDDVRARGLEVPVKEELDDRLLDFLKNKPWYTAQVEKIVRAQPLNRGEPPAVYTVLDKDDLHLNGVDHYKKYGSEYWQLILSVLSSNGYGVGREELCDFGRAYILGLDVRWEELDSCEKGYALDSIYENDIHNCSIALYRDVSAVAVSSIEIC